jgi:hypothetical protein
MKKRRMRRSHKPVRLDYHPVTGGANVFRYGLRSVVRLRHPYPSALPGLVRLRRDSLGIRPVANPSVTVSSFDNVNRWFGVELPTVRMVRIEMARSGWFELILTEGFCLCKNRKESRRSLIQAALERPKSNFQPSVGFVFEPSGEVGQIPRQSPAPTPASASITHPNQLTSDSPSVFCSLPFIFYIMVVTKSRNRLF